MHLDAERPKQPKFRRQFLTSIPVVIAVIRGILDSAAWGQTTPATVQKAKHEIEEASRRSDAAYTRRDVKTAMQVYTEDYQGEGISGNVWNKQQAQESLQKMLTFSRSVRGDSRIQNVTLTGSKATAAIVLSDDRTVHEIVNRKTGKAHSLVFASRIRSEWVRQNGQWKLRRTKQLTRSITRDGMPVTLKAKSQTKS